jgi:RNA polymerase sigma factor (sigma-70 family)
VADVPESRAPQDDLDLREALLAALRELEPIERVIVVQRYLLEVDVADVADELRLTPQAVRSRASRALAKVRTALETDVSGAARTTREA